MKIFGWTGNNTVSYISSNLNRPHLDLHSHERNFDLPNLRAIFSATIIKVVLISHRQIYICLYQSIFHDKTVKHLLVIFFYWNRN